MSKEVGVAIQDENQPQAVDQVMEKPSERWRKRIKERKPDVDLDADPEAFYGALDEYDEEVTGKLNRYQESDTKMRDLFLENPRMAGVFSDVVNGTRPELAIVKRFGEDVLAAKDDPSIAEELSKAQQEYMDNLSKSKKIEQEQEANMAKSIDLMNQYTQGKGLSDEEAEEFFNKIIQAVDAVFMCNFSNELLDIFYKGMNYDNDVNDAIDAGRVDERNKKIIEGSKRKVGDGMPSSTTTSPSTPENQPRQMRRRHNIFDY